MSMSIFQKDAYGMVFSNYPDIVSVAQMSKMLGISEKSAYRLLQENSIEHFRVGRTYKKMCIRDRSLTAQGQCHWHL